MQTLLDVVAVVVVVVVVPAKSHTVLVLFNWASDVVLLLLNLAVVVTFR